MIQDNECFITSIGKCFPGMAGTPVIKSWVTNGLKTTECWQEGVLFTESRSKCIGIKITGIWLNADMQFEDVRT